MLAYLAFSASCRDAKLDSIFTFNCQSFRGFRFVLNQRCGFCLPRGASFLGHSVGISVVNLSVNGWLVRGEPTEADSQTAKQQSPGAVPSWLVAQSCVIFWSFPRLINSPPRTLCDKLSSAPEYKRCNLVMQRNCTVQNIVFCFFLSLLFWTHW